MQLNPKITHYYKLVNGTLEYYCQTRTGDEAAFWQAPCPRSLLRNAHNWKTGPAFWYLAKVLLIRLVLGVVIQDAILFATAIAAIAGLIYLAFTYWR